MCVILKVITVFRVTPKVLLILSHTLFVPILAEIDFVFKLLTSVINLNANASDKFSKISYKN